MASPLKYIDDETYRKALAVFLERCDEGQRMRDFIHHTLPDILDSVGDGKSQLNVIGVGSGDGKNDLEMLSQLCLKHPGALVDNEVVEPSSPMLHDYRAMVAQTSGLEHIKFTWNEMGASEFEEQWKRKNLTKKVDFIHMVQMMSYVKDPEATISFFQSLLNKNGKLLIVLSSDQSSWGRLTKHLGDQLCLSENPLTSTDLRRLLDTRGVPYQRHLLLSHLDISQCLCEEDQNGALLLDFITHVQDFSQTASPELRRRVLSLLQDPQATVEREGGVFVKNLSEIIILDALS